MSIILFSSFYGKKFSMIQNTIHFVIPPINATNVEKSTTNQPIVPIDCIYIAQELLASFY